METYYYSFLDENNDIAGECSPNLSLSREIQAIKRKPDMPRYIVDGFVFHVNIMKGTPPMTYLRCLEYKRLGCHARAIIPCDGSIQDIKVKKPHNHPPDYTAEEKIVFLRELKEVMLQHPKLSSKEVYLKLSELYPTAARETPYHLIRHKMNRWRRASMPNFQNASEEFVLKKEEVKEVTSE